MEDIADHKDLAAAAAVAAALEAFPLAAAPAVAAALEAFVDPIEIA